MPNHISNELTGPKHVLDSLQSPADDGGVIAVDFNTVIPMPAVLDGDSAMHINRWAMLAMGRSAHLYGHEPFPKDFSEADFAMFLQRIRAIKETGFVSWFEWCCEKWGTKWNAYEGKRVSDTAVRFETAWSAPLPVIEALSLKFPSQPLSLRWASEDHGANTGSITMQNGGLFAGGRVENYSREAYALVLDLCFDGVVPDYMELIDGKLQYKPEAAEA